ncbi:dTDP-4-amino-4,6-dideoxygalactose transaminase [Pseudoroseomonas cervicalis]|uniref:dTDP-4-amino-4,6-dideoxygalactose transaminase n=1 Tax=Teichococcus cervicalis TaxID=204525 RepID=UPI0022F146D1|nr:dTDP-4-amino-4,6-dideoxygalactose transaminase [Pseudoroseomonas cervicalis]WBV45503.1 dTDP-4-amino-4,6-dideoxygalactose transaminase [Pseudoroseomonas cervicalis]
MPATPLPHATPLPGLGWAPAAASPLATPPWAAPALPPEAPPIPFYAPDLAGDEGAVLQALLQTGRLAGGGAQTELCHELLARALPGTLPLLTQSCTAALEMAALLLRLQPGDEVIMPAWTFCSTANAVLLRGAIPVFVDVQASTLNLDPACVAAAVTPRTRAVLCVHYAGVGCEMERLQALCDAHRLALVEDAAQAVGAFWRGRPLGGFGALGAYSFHASKNVTSGEGGALLVNDPALRDQAEMLWEKGTDRLRFARGEVARYTWQEIGSSFLPSELTAALLARQLARIEALTARRLRLWHRYDALLAPLAARWSLRRPDIPAEAAHNAHIYHLRFPHRARRDQVLARLNAERIGATTHYEPLHLSPAGRRHGRAAGPLPVTEDAAATLLRLPLHGGMAEAAQDRVVARLEAALAALPR